MSLRTSSLSSMTKMFFMTLEPASRIVPSGATPWAVGKDGRFAVKIAGLEPDAGKLCRPPDRGIGPRSQRSGGMNSRRLSRNDAVGLGSAGVPVASSRRPADGVGLESNHLPVNHLRHLIPSAGRRRLRAKTPALPILLNSYASYALAFKVSYTISASLRAWKGFWTKLKEAPGANSLATRSAL